VRTHLRTCSRSTQGCREEDQAMIRKKALPASWGGNNLLLSILGAGTVRLLVTKTQVGWKKRRTEDSYGTTYLVKKKKGWFALSWIFELEHCLMHLLYRVIYAYMQISPVQSSCASSERNRLRPKRIHKDFDDANASRWKKQRIGDSSVTTYLIMRLISDRKNYWPAARWIFDNEHWHMMMTHLQIGSMQSSCASSESNKLRLKKNEQKTFEKRMRMPNVEMPRKRKKHHQSMRTIFFFFFLFCFFSSSMTVKYLYIERDD
jgi:hypothetical protein